MTKVGDAPLNFRYFGERKMTSVADLVTAIGVLGPEDRLLIQLKEGITMEVLEQVKEEFINVFPGVKFGLFSGDMVQDLVIIRAPIDTVSIVDGSRQILEEMKSVTDKVTGIENLTSTGI